MFINHIKRIGYPYISPTFKCFDYFSSFHLLAVIPYLDVTLNLNCAIDSGPLLQPPSAFDRSKMSTNA